MRVASILCQNFLTTREQIKKALPFSDVIELRLDYLPDIFISDIKTLREEMTLPVIFTLRRKNQGGQCHLPEPERLKKLEQLASLSPDYLDLEFDVPVAFVHALQKQYPTIQYIGSYHDFEKTPADLEKLFQAIYQPYFSIFKLATFAHDICDTLRLLIFTQKTNQKQKIITMAMGEYGQASRILSPVVGSLMSYGSIDETSSAAPGQLTLQEMTDIYRVQQLNTHTGIYALLGDPIAQSPGHIFHNQKFAANNQNAVYVKLKISPEKLAEAITLLRQLPFCGFSVTIPHKETVMQYLDEISPDAKEMGAVNTIKKENNEYVGFNTDGIASVDVLSEATSLSPVIASTAVFAERGNPGNIKAAFNKKILILGAGGSAKAIAYALTKNGARVTLCNRTLERAKIIAQQLGADAINFTALFSQTELDYDIIINTLPAQAFIEQCADWHIPSPPYSHAIAMDIVLKPLDTLFLKHAKTAGFMCIGGDALFVAQAMRQQIIWQTIKK